MKIRLLKVLCVVSIAVRNDIDTPLMNNQECNYFREITKQCLEIMGELNKDGRLEKLNRSLVNQTLSDLEVS